MKAANVDWSGLFYPSESGESLALSGMTIEQLFTHAASLQGEGKQAQAAHLYKSWIAFNGDHQLLHAAYFNFAVALYGIGDVLGAINANREAIRRQPSFISPYVNLGRVLEEAGHTGAAIVEWMKGCEQLSGVTGEALSNKVSLLTQCGRLLEEMRLDVAAEDALRQAIELQPEYDEAMLHLVGLRLRQCHWPVIKSVGKTSAERVLKATSPLSLSNLTDDPMLHLGAAYAFCARTVARPSLAAIRRVAAARKPSEGRLKIGYVSSDLREHAVGFALTEIFELHDRSRFETFAYYCGPQRDDPTQRRIKAAAEHWFDLNGLSDEEAALRIAADGIDILVDLNGYTKFARTGVFALRPAPVAVNWFGYPGTMASPFHHYLIADPSVIPPGSEVFYTEEIVRLPCYQPNDRQRVVAEKAPTRAEVGLPDDAFVFCSFNGSQKLTRHTYERWLAILRETPGSVLWLLAASDDVHERLRAYAAARGVERERIVFADKLANPNHLARYPLADLFLDSFPYGAHTTASDSLWMGVPILTLSGRCFAARVCASLLRAAGLPELVCETPEAYVALGVMLGRNKALVSAMRERLRAGRTASTLFDTPKFVAALEQAFLLMKDRHTNGTTPRPDLANLQLYHEIGSTFDPERMETASSAEYMAIWQEALTERDAAYPITPDQRFWRAPA